MRSIFSVFAAILVAATVSACQSVPKDPATQSAVSNYYASEVVMKQTADFSTGLATLGDADPIALANQFSDEAHAKVSAELPSLMKGNKPARVTVLLETASIASGAGRVLVGSDSEVVSVVSIADVETGKIIASRKIRAADVGAKNTSAVNGVPVGALISMVANASNSGEEQRISLISDAFAEEVKKWLEANQG